MREHINVVETAMRTVTLLDLYSQDELDDPEETLYHHVSEDIFDHAFIVHEMSPDEASRLSTLAGDTTVIGAFDSFADGDQKRIVKTKMKNFDRNRIVVLDGEKVIDGNHHVIAAVKLGMPVSYINLGEAP